VQSVTSFGTKRSGLRPQASVSDRPDRPGSWNVGPQMDKETVAFIGGGHRTCQYILHTVFNIEALLVILSSAAACHDHDAREHNTVLNLFDISV